MTDKFRIDDEGRAWIGDEHVKDAKVFNRRRKIHEGLVDGRYGFHKSFDSDLPA